MQLEEMPDSTLRLWPAARQRKPSKGSDVAEARSSWDRDFFEDLAHDGDDFCSFNLEFRSQDHAMLEDWLYQDAHIVRSHIVSAVQCGMGATGQEKGLSRARAGAD